jgi:transposase
LILELIDKSYPEAKCLQQVAGVGPLISLCFILTIGDPNRFQKSRQVGPYLGLVPSQRESGQSAPELRISKAGNGFLRQLLVNGAHYILGYRGPDCGLRRWGLERASGGKSAKKRAVIGVARRLAILLHRLWVTGEVYEPLRHVEVAA